jgi:hypothetical protein
MPRLGDIGVTPGTTWPMRLIRIGTMSRYGHVCIVANEPVDGGQVLIGEAMPDGFRYRWLPAGSDEFVWLDFRLSDEQRAAVGRGLNTAEGIPYDWWSIVLFVLRFWGVKVRGKSNDHSDDKLICSEAAVWLYRDFADSDLFPGIAPGDVSPGDIADLWFRDEANMLWLEELRG